jgi:hypothetical protein
MMSAAKEYHRIGDLLDSIEHAAQPGAIRYDKENVSTSPNVDAIPNAVIKRMERKADLEAARQQYSDEYDEFCDKLLLLDSVGGTYLHDYHTGRFSHWTDIWRYYHIDGKTGRRRREEALLELYEKGLVPHHYMMPNHKAI